jgi:DNA modification methylase
MAKYILMIGDNRERLKEIEPETVNLVVTSPPYAWDFRYSEKKQQLGEIYDTRLFFQELTTVWKLCYRTLVPGGYIAVVWADIQDAKKVYGKYCIEPLVEGMVRSMRMANFDLISQWIWRKYEPGASVIVRPYLEYSQMATGYYIPKSGSNWEYVYVWRKPSGVTQPVFDVKESEWYPHYLDGVWNIPYGPEDKDAACFPIELAKRLIKIYTKPGMTVLDPFLGSGTTMKACVDLGRNCIGVEVDVNRLPRIKEKVGWGNQKLMGDVEWIMK